MNASSPPRAAMTRLASMIASRVSWLPERLLTDALALATGLVTDLAAIVPVSTTSHGPQDAPLARRV